MLDKCRSSVGAVSVSEREGFKLLRPLQRKRIIKSDCCHAVAALKQEEGSIGKTSRKPTRLATGNVSAGQVLNQAVQANKRTLVYSSKMLAESSEQALDLISQIMAKAVVSNAAHGIHAVTNFNPVNLEVVQTMHGEEAKVRQLYDNVEHDTRHVITKKGVFTSAESSTTMNGNQEESSVVVNPCEGFSTMGLDGKSEPEQSEENLLRCVRILPHTARPAPSMRPAKVSQLTPESYTPGMS